MEDVVSSTIYLSKYTEDFTTMNPAYVAAFPDPKPSRTCIGVSEVLSSFESADVGVMGLMRRCFSGV